MSIEKIAAKIKVLRQAKELTQEQMADLLNLTHSAYAKLERGETNINYTRIVELSKILEIQPHDLINLQETHSLVFNFLQGGIGYGIGQNPVVQLQLPKEEIDGMNKRFENIEQQLIELLKKVNNSENK
jgi:transcriptional regulator with XRE-family HTH domain